MYFLMLKLYLNSKFIKNNLYEHVRADTAGSAKMISINKKVEAAIASALSAETYGLEIIQKILKTNLEI